MVAKGHRPLILDGISMAAQGLISFDDLRLLGSFYLPPPGTPAAKLLQQTLSDRCASGASHSDGILFNVARATAMSPDPSNPTLAF